MTADTFLPFALFSLMFAMGLSLTWADFARAQRDRKSFLFTILSIIALLPTLGFAIAYLFELPAELAIGLILVAACPGGTFSNLLTSYARGDLALSISLTASVSLIAILTLPVATTLALSLFGASQTQVTLPFLETLTKVFVLTILPVMLGMLIRPFSVRHQPRLADNLKNASAVLIVGLFLAIIFDNRSDFAAALQATWPAVLALNVCSVSAGLLLSFLLGLKVDQLIAVTIEHGIKQEGTGIFVAIGILGLPVAALPLLLNSLIGILIGTGFTAFVRLIRIRLA